MSIADAAPTAVVAGLGRPDRGDDGVGAEVVRLLSTEDLPGVSVQVLEDPTALIDTWAAVPVAVVVDAVVSGRPPGTVITRDVGARAEPLSSRAWGADASRGSSHALGVATAVELSRALGRLPDRVVLVGVEAGSVDFGWGLTAPVAAAVPGAAAAVLAALGLSHRPERSEPVDPAAPAGRVEAG